MAGLDWEGTALLKRLSADHPNRFAEEPDVTAHDTSDRLALTIDCVRRITGVTVLDVGALRTQTALTEAFTDAFGSAEGQRAAAALESNGALEDALEAAGRSVRDTSRPPSPTRNIVTREASTARREARARGELPPRQQQPTAGVSDNGYVIIQRSADGAIASVTADAEWLSAATAQHLEAALEQAARFGQEN